MVIALIIIVTIVIFIRKKKIALSKALTETFNIPFSTKQKI
jgi:hypothetical protein